MSRALQGRKLLVASAGVAAVTYGGACGSHSVGNFMAPPPEEGGTVWSSPETGPNRPFDSSLGAIGEVPDASAGDSSAVTSDGSFDASADAAATDSAVDAGGDEAGG